MKTKSIKKICLLCISILLLFAAYYKLSAQTITIKIHLRGVYETKINLLPLSGANALKPVFEISSIKNGSTGIIKMDKDDLPGEFVIRFDYKEKESSTAYPAEKQIFISNQSLELWVNPPYCNNADSTWFQKGEKENTSFGKFTKTNGEKKEKLALLQNLLMNYDDTKSTLFAVAIDEYEKRRQEYNEWLAVQVKQNKDKFISTVFGFQYIPRTDWKGTEAERMQSMITHYFDGMDFKDSLIIKTTDIKEWMNKYVNFCGALAISDKTKDSLLLLAAKISIGKASTGHPRVYGWMVDYFYNGFESFNIPAGIKMLEVYLNDPRCLTSKKQAIEKRVMGMKSLVAGSLAPDFIFKNDAGKWDSFRLHKTNSRYKLVLFWSATCDHCQQLVNKLYPWHQKITDKNLVDVFTISLDETETEINTWKNAVTQLRGWKHIRAENGVNSKEANAYFILSTPVMIVVDAKTNKVLALPADIEGLKKLVGNAG